MGCADEPVAQQRLGTARRLTLAAAANLHAQPADAASEPAPAASAASAPRYAFDPTHTAVHWEVVHMGTSTIRGRFDKLAGTADTLSVLNGQSPQRTPARTGVPFLRCVRYLMSA